MPGGVVNLFSMCNAHRPWEHWIIDLGFAISLQVVLVSRDLGQNDSHACFSSLDLTVVSLKEFQRCLRWALAAYRKSG